MGKIIVGILFIIGGVSGQFVLIGTNSNVALIIAGVVWVVWGIVRLDVNRHHRRSRSSRGTPSDSNFKKPSKYDY